MVQILRPMGRKSGVAETNWALDLRENRYFKFEEIGVKVVLLVSSIKKK